jgi:DNA-binding IclR family transcriptional regulator
MVERIPTPAIRRQKGDGGALQGVGRAFDILECLADRPMTATEVVHVLEIKWATAHRTLRYLLGRGYLERDEQTGTYHIGARAYSIGGAYVTDLPIVRVARAHLPDAVDESGATAQLVKRDGDRSVVLSVFEPRTNSLPDTSVGYNFPLNCSSKGHVLLAYADEAVVEAFLAGPLPALTPYSITDPEKLRARLELVRRRGYAVTARDTRLFSGSVSAPVHQSDGRVVACVTLIVPAANVEKVLPRLIDTATRTAEAISLMLGWRPGVVHARARVLERPAV